MQRVQRQMDEIILDTDFNAIDWSRWGMPPLPKPVTPELKQQLQVTLRALRCTSDMLADGEAGAQGAEWERVISAGLLPDDWRPLNAEATPGYETLPLRTRGYPPRGLFPAMCPPCYDDGALELCSHPQMLALHAQLMGTTTDRVRFVRLDFVLTSPVDC